MGELEIVENYKASKCPTKQIRILAELNNTSPEQIKAILAKHGVLAQKRGRIAAESSDKALIMVIEAKRRLAIEKIQKINVSIERMKAEQDHLGEAADALEKAVKALKVLCGEPEKEADDEDSSAEC